MNASTAVVPELTRTEARSVTVAGIIIAVLGLFAAAFPLLTGVSVSVLFGAVLVAGAFVHASNAFSTRTFGSALGQALLAVLYGLAGVAFLANPAVGLAALTLVAVAFFVVDGFVEVAWGLRSRGQPGAQWLLVSGGLSLLLAGALWLGFPSSAGWAVGVLLGVNLLVTGLSMVVVGRGSGEPTPPAVPRGSQG